MKSYFRQAVDGGATRGVALFEAMRASLDSEDLTEATKLGCVLTAVCALAAGDALGLLAGPAGGPGESAAGEWWEAYGEALAAAGGDRVEALRLTLLGALDAGRAGAMVMFALPLAALLLYEQRIGSGSGVDE